MLLSALTLLGCPGLSVSGSRPDPDSGTVVSTEEVGGPADDIVRKRVCRGLYDPEALQEFSLDLEANAWSDLQSDYANGQKNYHPATFTWGEETHDVQVRLKGNPYFSWLGDKLQFVISFNEEDPEARFHGVRKLALDSTWYEPTLLRDRLAWSMLRAVPGMPALCANSARLDINGAYYGLYANIEYMDHEWLEETFGDDYADGTLWKYGEVAKTNEELADDRLVRQFFEPASVSELEELGDVEEWLLAWAGEAVLGDDDGYWCCAHNFYIYEHPTRDLLMVPWDLDDLFDVTPYGLDPIEGYTNPWGLFEQGPFMALTADSTWRSVYVDAVETVTDALDPETWIPRIDTWDAQISGSLAEDPHRSIGVEEHEQAIEQLEAYLPARQAYLRSWIACERGETTDADGDGHPVCSDPNDGDPSVHPGATETCNGLDDDANAHSVNDVPAEPACVGGTQERPLGCIERRPQPSTHRSRRRRGGRGPGRGGRFVGAARARDHETGSEYIQLPETGPEGRIYRQLGDKPRKAVEVPGTPSPGGGPVLSGADHSRNKGPFIHDDRRGATALVLLHLLDLGAIPAVLPLVGSQVPDD